MATINCSVHTSWNDTKCHRLAGTGYDKFYPHITVEGVGSQSEKNGKRKYSNISSDGYYGYLPAVPDIDDYAMDTNDAGAENSMENGRDPKNDSCISALTNMQNLRENFLSVGITLGRRKRLNDEYNTTAEPKRQRQGEHDSVSEKVSDSSLHFTIDGCDLELVEKLLKETHGCELYHFDACDL